MVGMVLEPDAACKLDVASLAGSTWEQAIADCFAKKLGIQHHVQLGSFVMDMTWCSRNMEIRHRMK
eukprot:5874550-Amphidinium_carterae.1